MTVRYVPEQRLIVFDHLSPSQPKFANHKETYGPDMTYSGYRLRGDKWLYQDNLDMRNSAAAQDTVSFVDPKKQAAIDKASITRKPGSH
jgi:hypothetical protein